MQAALPLVRSVSHALATPASRIPHLEYHIVRKLHRSRKSGYASSTTPQQQQSRSRSSTADVNLNALWPAATYDSSLATDHETTTASIERSRPTSQYRTIDFSANNVPDHIPSQSPTFTDLSSTSYQVSASELLDEASPERLLTWLAAHPGGHAFTASATKEEFDRAFCALDPAVLVEPFVRAKRHLGRGADGDWELSFRRSLVHRLRTFSGKIDDILIRRREFGTPLTLDVCRHALKCAASVGDVRTADHIWDNLMTAGGIQPDIVCYNAYLHAHMWNLAHSEISRVSFRNTERNMTLRSQIQRPRNLIGYSVSSQRPEPDWALKAKTLAIFQDITNKGLVTDEATFINLITALGRSADLPGVTSILKSVWNIDVDALESYDEEELESPTFYPEGHPLVPTAKLLFAVVHAYAINHRVLKAWNLLDYISRNYALTIPEYVWNELFEWTFVLGLPRSKAKQKQGQAEGKIHLREVENLFDTLTDEPHNVQPSPLILDLLARSYRKRGMLDRTLETVREAEEDMLQHLNELRLMIDTITAMLRNPEGIVDNGMLSQKFIKFRNDFQLAYLSIRQRYAFFMIEIRRIVKENEFAGAGNRDTWSSTRLPQVVEEFAQYLPNFGAYRMRTGDVNIRFAEHRDAAQDATHVRSLLLEANAIYETLDTLDLFEMVGDLSALQETLKDIRRQKRYRDPLGSERLV